MALLLLAFISLSACMDTYEKYLTTMEMAKYWGYPIEEHLITTADGFILKVFRIPGRQGESLEFAKSKKRQPVIFQHGITCSTDNLLDAGEHSQPYTVADAGYDVWLINIRGNRYSRDHLTYDKDDPRYWDFETEKVARYDQKAYWEYIMNITGYTKLASVAHSQGVTQMFVAMILEPEYYSQHLSTFVGQSPIYDMRHTTSVPLIIASYIDLFLLLEKLNIRGILQHSKTMAHVFVLLSKIEWFKNFGIHLVADYYAASVKEERSEVLFSHYPSGSSSKNFRHIMQLIKYGFVKYREKLSDKLEYYDMSKIPKDISMALMVGTADRLATVTDTRALKSLLLNNSVNLKFYKEYQDLGHLSVLVPNDTLLQYTYDTVRFLKENYKI